MVEIRNDFLNSFGYDENFINKNNLRIYIKDQVGYNYKKRGTYSIESDLPLRFE